MDDTIYKIATAGYLHDIGKFAERAGMAVSNEFANNNAFYQPFFNGTYSHKHVVYTAAFIDFFEEHLPKQFNRSDWGLDDSFFNLAAGHHNPATPLQWIIAIADRVSSGFDRGEFDNYNKSINVRDYKKTRLLTIFENLVLNKGARKEKLEEFKYRYPLKELNPLSVFPVSTDEARKDEGTQSDKEYKNLFDGFTKSLEKLEHKYNISLWFEHFDSLFRIFASHIPAASVGKVVPDVSLYDHCKTTAAFGTALYLYHRDTQTMNETDIKNYEPQKFLLISGDFYGIQDFIFSEGGSTGKASAKLLRGRSFSVSLITELAADMFCRQIGLPISSVLLNAAGKFMIVAPNTEQTVETVRKVDEKLNDWLIRHFFGQSSIGISTVTASCDDFVSHKYDALNQKLHKASERRKFAKIDLNKYGGVKKDYLDSFDNTVGICPYCGKRPAKKDIHAADKNSCAVCRDHIYIGEHLVRENRLAITTINADLKSDKLKEPIFDEYQISFDVSGKLGELARAGTLLRYWDIGISDSGNLSKDITAKNINGYVPKYSKEDNHDDRLFYGKKSDKTKKELIDSIAEGAPKTFLHIAKKALNPTDKKDKFTGIEAIGVLKADVDRLGEIFANGLDAKFQTISRTATLSRQLDNFFSMWLPYTLKTEGRFNDIYTLFAGGDDLFIIGPWNRIIDAAEFIREKFSDYVCNNLHISLSAGMVLHKPSVPVRTLSDSAEESLGSSKEAGRNAFTLFGQTVSWQKFAELQDVKNTLLSWIENGTINNAMLYRLNELISMASQEKAIKSKNSVTIDDMECLKWRARLTYTVARNVAKNKKGAEKQQIIQEVKEKLFTWLNNYGGALRIALWQILYNKRGGKG